MLLWIDHLRHIALNICARCVWVLIALCLLQIDVKFINVLVAFHNEHLDKIRHGQCATTHLPLFYESGHQLRIGLQYIENLLLLIGIIGAGIFQCHHELLQRLLVADLIVEILCVLSHDALHAGAHIHHLLLRRLLL